MFRFTEPRRRRARERGAAMAEAVIVLSTLLVFLGLIVWTRNSYVMKLDMQQTTRSSALYYAAHGCSGEHGQASAAVGGQVLDSSPEVSKVGKKSNLPASGAASRTWNTASAELTKDSNFAAVWDKNGGTGSMDLEQHALHRTIRAGSKVSCTEPTYDGDSTEWIEYGANFVKGNFSGVTGFFQ